MRRLLAAVLSAPLALAAVGPASAAEHAGFSIQACGTSVTLELIKDTTRFKEREFRFQASGNAVVRASDGDSSVDIRVPGRVAITDDVETGVRTIVLTGSTLLLPETPGQAAALAAAGLPRLALIKGRVVLTERIDAQGMAVPGSERVVRFTPNVTDVCALLAR